MQDGNIAWGSDVPVSAPQPLVRPGLVDMGGFAFTIRGIAHDFSEAEREIYEFPTFAPDYFGRAGDVPV